MHNLCAGAGSPTPKIHDIGILTFINPISFDRTCLDKNQLGK